MKSFNKFLEEISIEGNPGIPGEPSKKSGENKWKEDVERRAKSRLDIRPQDISTNTPFGFRPSRKNIELGQRLMELVGESSRWINGHESELEELALNTFVNLYESIINRYEVEVDIKFIKPGRVKNWMDEQEEDDDQPEMPQFKKVVEEDIKNEVYKRKIANLIIQGEAKNTKHILHSEQVKDGLREIYGDDAEEVFDIWDEMTKIADQLDWIIPVEVKQDMMEQMPEGMAGASTVGWKPKKKDEDEDEEDEEEYYGGDDEEEMYDEEDYEEDEPMERFDSTPIIKARGIDFPMLLHESVKALFELLSIPGIPEDERTANIALSNTGMEDEPEDFRYGPEIAADLRDFINENKDIDKYPNIREEVYKMMVDKDTMPTKDFLDLMRGILSKTQKARRDIDKIISKVISELEEMDKYKKDMEEYEKEMKDWEKRQKNIPTTDNLPKNDTTSPENVDDNDENVDDIDYSKMGMKDLQTAMDNALDNEDYTLAHKISKFMNNESKKIYDRELKIILENKNLHTK